MRIPAYIYKELVKRAQEANPAEACGVIVVTPGGVMQVIEIQNVAARPTREFAFHKGEQLKIIRTIHRENLQLAFIWHSHTVGSHRPSPADLASACNQDPRIIHLILFGDELFAYQMAHGWETYRTIDIVIE